MCNCKGTRAASNSMGNQRRVGQNSSAVVSSAVVKPSRPVHKQTRHFSSHHHHHVPFEKHSKHSDHRRCRKVKERPGQWKVVTLGLLGVGSALYYFGHHHDQEKKDATKKVVFEEPDQHDHDQEHDQDEDQEHDKDREMPGVHEKLSDLPNYRQLKCSCEK